MSKMKIHNFNICLDSRVYSYYIIVQLQYITNKYIITKRHFIANERTNNCRKDNY